MSNDVTIFSNDATLRSGKLPARGDAYARERVALGILTFGLSEIFGYQRIERARYTRTPVERRVHYYPIGKAPSLPRGAVSLTPAQAASLATLGQRTPSTAPVYAPAPPPLVLDGDALAAGEPIEGLYRPDRQSRSWLYVLALLGVGTAIYVYRKRT